jgi:hypothetical protein
MHHAYIPGMMTPMKTETVTAETITRRPFTVRAAEGGGKIWIGRSGEVRVYFGQSLYGRVVDDQAGIVAWTPVGRINTITHAENMARAKAAIPWV